MTINMMLLREKVAVANFTAEERDLILNSLALGRYEGKHSYPETLGPTHSDPSVRASWAILDQLPPNAMTVAHRFLLAGLMAGAISETKRGKR